MKFVLPRDLPEAEARIETLQGSVEQIIEQLTNPNRLDPETKSRMDFDVYQDWAEKAFYALKCKIKEIRALKSWSHRAERDAQDSDPEQNSKIKGLLEKLYYMNADLTDLTEDEKAAMNSAEKMLFSVESS